LRYDIDMPKHKKKIFKRQWIFIGLMAILFMLMLGLNSRLSEYFRLTGQKKEMELRIENLSSTQVALQTQIAYADSEKAVEEWARTFERMVLPGDQPIIPHPLENVTPEIHYLDTPQPDDEQNWEIWWELFFE